MPPRRFRALAAALAVVFALDSAAHLLWATGSTWPADDTRLLSYALLGSEVSFAPGVLLPLAGITAAAAAMVWLRVRLGRRHRLGPILQFGTLALFTLLCACHGRTGVGLRHRRAARLPALSPAQPAPAHAAVPRARRRRVLLVGIAAAPAGPGRTRVAMTGGLRVPGRAALVPVGVKSSARGALRRLADLV